MEDWNAEIGNHSNSMGRLTRDVRRQERTDMRNRFLSIDMDAKVWVGRRGACYTPGSEHGRRVAARSASIYAHVCNLENVEETLRRERRCAQGRCSSLERKDTAVTLCFWRTW